MKSLPMFCSRLFHDSDSPYCMQLCGFEMALHHFLPALGD